MSIYMIFLVGCIGTTVIIVAIVYLASNSKRDAEDKVNLTGFLRQLETNYPRRRHHRESRDQLAQMQDDFHELALKIEGTEDVAAIKAEIQKFSQNLGGDNVVRLQKLG